MALIVQETSVAFAQWFHQTSTWPQGVGNDLRSQECFPGDKVSFRHCLPTCLFHLHLDNFSSPQLPYVLSRIWQGLRRGRPPARTTPGEVVVLGSLPMSENTFRSLTAIALYNGKILWIWAYGTPTSH